MISHYLSSSITVHFQNSQIRMNCARWTWSLGSNIWTASRNECKTCTENTQIFTILLYSIPCVALVAVLIDFIQRGIQRNVYSWFLKLDLGVFPSISTFLIISLQYNFSAHHSLLSPMWCHYINQLRFIVLLKL